MIISLSSSNFAASWDSIAWNGNVFCLASSFDFSNIFSISSDGAQWANVTLPGTSSFTSTAWNGSVFCSGSKATMVMTSPDGEAWTQRAFPVDINCSVVLSVDGVFYAIGGDTVAVSTMLRSVDGITWTQHSLPASMSLYGATWNGSIFCAVGANRIATSSNGTTWSYTAAPSGLTYKKIVWNGTIFCALSNYLKSGYQHKCIISTDGVAWTEVVLPTPSSGSWASIAWNGTVFCIIAYNSN